MSEINSAWSVYLEHALKQIDHEHQQRTSLFTRAVAVISTTGVILSVLFALERAFSPYPEKIHSFLSTLLLGAVGCFLLAAIMAVTILLPRRKKWHIPFDLLKSGLEFGGGNQQAIAAQRDIGNAVIESVKDIRDANKNGLMVLAIALVLEVAGIVLVGAVVGLILLYY